MELHEINWANNLDADITSSPSTIKVEPDNITFLDDIGKEIKPQLLDTPTSLKLKSLKLHGASGGVYESVIINCDQIKFLCLANLYHNDNSRLYGMITRNNKRLKYLTISSFMKELELFSGRL
ncbi:3466_t:CDS:2 [Funneliformis mosseae]|uniref:3466_t:CDS:1 n=1 Tax=Funneliformis mosseae TaxID=27381 RepID=A0A9N9CSU9_FUNMO|nr:3466_t:CDS:2 [Funneliformis mosseae]